jgi:transposase InsO family protein
LTADVHLIAAEAHASVSAVCRTLGMPRSSAYARRARGRLACARELDNGKLDVEITATFHEHRGRYGSPRIHRLIRRLRPLARKRVAARMRVLGLQARHPKRFRRTTKVDPTKAVAPNVLDRQFQRERIDEAWVADISYIWTQAGWVYLALIVELCTRGIIGWAVSQNCDTKLALTALEQAVARRRPPAGVIHHSDRGSTYTADDYRNRLKELGMVCSMSRKGNCWDNAVAESTIGTIKTELLVDDVPEDVHALRANLFQYIEVYYNRNRLHSSIGYHTPAQYEQIVTARGSNTV